MKSTEEGVTVPLVIIGLLVLAIIWLFHMQPVVEYYPKTVGAGQIKECTDKGGHFEAFYPFTGAELKVVCTVPEKVINY